MLQALSDEHGALQRLADDSNVLVTVVPDFPTTVASKCFHIVAKLSAVHLLTGFVVLFDCLLSAAHEENQARHTSAIRYHHGSCSSRGR
jgi:hypothetical protein